MAHKQSILENKISKHKGIMGPDSHSTMLPKAMAGSGARMTQKWQRNMGGGGRVGAGRLA